MVPWLEVQHARLAALEDKLSVQGDAQGAGEDLAPAEQVEALDARMAALEESQPAVPTLAAGSACRIQPIKLSLDASRSAWDRFSLPTRLQACCKATLALA